jgi:hypothetical protein
VVYPAGRVTQPTANGADRYSELVSDASPDGQQVRAGEAIGVPGTGCQLGLPLAVLT